jgi:outer membrane autotransporter protein
VAAALSTPAAPADFDTNSLFRDMLLLDGAAATIALRTTTGEIHPGTVNSLRAGSRDLNRLLAGRASATAHAVAGARISSDTTDATGAAGDSVDARYFFREAVSPNFWLSGVRGFGDVDDDSRASALDYDYDGFFAGFDLNPSDTLSLGLFAGHLRHATNMEFGTDEADVDSFYIGARAALRAKKYYMHSALAFAVDDYDVDRRAIVGATADLISANYDGSQTSGYVEAGLIRDTAEFGVRPYLSLYYLEIRTDGFSEKADSDRGLRIQSDTYRDVSSALGLSLSREIVTGTLSLNPEIRVGWEHQWTTTADKRDARFIASGAAFRISSASTPRDAAIVQLSLPVTLRDPIAVFAEYGGRFDTESSRHSIMAGIQIAW